jgi:hypothetical protein
MTFMWDGMDGTVMRNGMGMHITEPWDDAMRGEKDLGDV